jgi:cytochrome c-type biogenesis protein CcmH/NrfG
MALERFDEAVVAYGRALEINPADKEIQEARKNAFRKARR